MDIPTRLMFVINFMSQVRKGNFQRHQNLPTLPNFKSAVILGAGIFYQSLKLVSF